MKCRTEMRNLYATLAVLVALSVPVAAAVFASGAPAPPVELAHGPSTASTELWISGAPPPLLIMLLGTLVVAATVVRHVRTRRSPLTRTLSASFERRATMPTAH